LQPVVTVVVPTLAGDAALLECLASLESQTLAGIQVVVVDNSGGGRARRLGADRFGFRLIENKVNVGFGAAINQGFRLMPARYLATLNDDAVADPRWLETMVQELEKQPNAGMGAPRIVMAGTQRLDSAGMLLARDGSSKQRGHGETDERYLDTVEVLLPSGCAALYRGAMLDEIGLFDEDFFLYCEDTDLGLRGRWAGWTCIYTPDAVVEHRYSGSAGRASELKAFLVERNRLRMTVRCLPWDWLLANALWASERYFWHAAFMFRGKGKASEFRASGGSGLKLPWLVAKAHADLLLSLPRLLGERRQIARTRRMTSSAFKDLLARHSIPLRQVAAL